MTVSMLYGLYCSGHRDVMRLLAVGFSERALERCVSRAGVTALERVILELALHDATNGTPMRSRERFDRAVEQGAPLLRSLGLRLDRQERAAIDARPGVMGRAPIGYAPQDSTRIVHAAFAAAERDLA